MIWGDHQVINVEIDMLEDLITKIDLCMASNNSKNYGSTLSVIFFLHVGTSNIKYIYHYTKNIGNYDKE